MSEFLEGLDLNQTTGDLLVLSNCLTENQWTSCVYIVEKEQLEDKSVWHSTENVGTKDFRNKMPFNFSICAGKWVNANEFIFSTDSGHLIMMTFSPQDAKTKFKELMSVLEHDDEVSCLDAFYDSDFAVTGSADSTIKLWDLNEKISTHTWQAYDQPIRTISICPADKNLILSCAEDGRNLLWDARKNNPAFLLGNPLKGTVSASKWSPTNQNVIALGSKLGQVGTFDIRNIKTPDHSSNLILADAHSRQVRSVKFSPDGKMLASCAEDMALQAVRLDSPDASKPIYKSQQMGDKLTDLVWHQGKIISSSWDGTLAIHALNVKK